MTDRQACAVAATAIAALIVYGSLVPFDLSPLNRLDILVGLQRIPFSPWAQVSATDFLVNVGVGLPLGFFLIGAWPSTRGHGPLSAAGGVLAAASLSTLLAAGVEALQVFSPTRDSSWNDVLAQTLGAIAGTVVWAARGRQLLCWMRHLSDEPDLSRRAVLLLQLFVPIYVALQLTSVDTLRVAKLATKYAGDPVTSVGSSEIDARFVVLADWIGNALLNAPIGALAGLGWFRGGQRRRFGRAFVLGVGILGLVSVTQILAGLGTVLVGRMIAAALGIAVGIMVTTQFLLPGHDGPRARWGLARAILLLATAVWLVLLVCQAWQPFDFQLTSEIVRRRLTRVSLVPFVFYYWYASYILSPLQAVHEGLLHFVMAVPLGLLPRLAWRTSRDRRGRQLQSLVIVLTATAALIAIELGQIFLPTRFADVTDVLIGVIGVIAGESMGRAFALRWQGVSDGVHVEAASGSRSFNATKRPAQIPNDCANDTRRPRKRRAVKRSTARS